MIEKFCKLIYTVLFLAAFGLCMVSLAEPWLIDDISGGGALCMTVVCLIAWGLMTYVIKRSSDQACSIYVKAGIAVAFCIQLYIAVHMKVIPDVDLSHIYDQVLVMIEESTHVLTNQKFFGFYTNNIPITIVVYWLFRIASWMHITDFRLVGGIFNVFMILLTYIGTFKILKRLFDAKITAFIMGFLLLNPAFYAYAPYYYTDTLSLPFMIWGTYFICCGYEAKNVKRASLWYIGAGALLGFATQIRATSIFIAIAVFVWMLLHKHWRELLRLICMLGLGLLFFSGLWSMVYHYHVDFDTKESAVTVDHFIMMGSNAEKDGRYYGEDVLFSRSFLTHEERVKQNREVFIERVKEKGIIGNVIHLLKKQATVWCVGHKNYLQYMEHVEEENLCYQWIRGEKSQLFRWYMQAYNNVMLMLICAGNALALFRGNGISVSAIYWGGALIFVTLWEAHPRHSVSFSVFMCLLMVPFVKMMLKKVVLRKENT